MAATKLPFTAKTYAASRESNIELLIPASDFMVNSTLKILKGISVECTELLNEDAYKKKEEKNMTLSVHVQVGMIKLLSVPNCLILRTSIMDSVVI